MKARYKHTNLIAKDGENGAERRLRDFTALCENRLIDVCVTGTRC